MKKHWINHLLFLVFVIGIVGIISLFVSAARILPIRQTTIAIATIGNSEPPYDQARSYVTKNEFDKVYELERYWNFDRLQYMEKVFLPRKIFAMIGEKYSLSATPQEIRQRILEEQHRAGRTLDAWKKLLAINEVSPSDVDLLFREKILAEKMMNAMPNVQISDEEVLSFYRAALKNISGWESFDVVKESAERETLQYKKLAVVVAQAMTGTYYRMVQLIPSPYLCRKSS